MQYNEQLQKFQTYASLEEVLEVKTASNRLDLDYNASGKNLAKFAAAQNEGDIEGGYIYVRARAISSRVNKNNDGWPSEELGRAYKTFVGRPVFVDHNNSNPERTRGVIVDSKLHVDDEKTSALDPYYSSAPANHKPPTWVEILIEVDAETYPKLGKAIKNNDIDAVSMGANIDRSTCSVCSNEAANPNEYCSHVKQKGATFEIVADNGEKVKKKAYEDCYGVNFFEISFVFDPADTTALNLGVEDKPSKLSNSVSVVQSADFTSLMVPVTAADLVNTEDRNLNHEPQSEKTKAPDKIDTLRDDIQCPNCDADRLMADPDGIMRCPTCGFEQPPEGLDNPDLNKAREVEDRNSDSGDGVVRATEEDVGDAPASSGGSSSGDFIQPILPLSATKTNVTTGVISEMIWHRKIQTTSAAEANEALKQVTAGGTDTTIVYAGGIHNGTSSAFQRLGLSANITYPGAPGPMTLPGSMMPHMITQMKAKQHLGLASVSDLPVHVDAADEQLDTILQCIHEGGDTQENGFAWAPTHQPAHQLGATNKPKGDVLVPGGKPKGDEPTGEKIVSDQPKPVYSDRRVIKREETPDGHKTEQIVEETGDLLEDSPINKKETEENNEEENDSNEPKAQKDRENDNRPDFLKERDKEPVAASVEDPQKKLLAALAVAEDAVDMGVIAKDKKMAFVGQLEEETMEQIDARRQTLVLVKSAGLTNRRVASHQSRALPRFAGMGLPTPTTNDTNLDDIPFEAIFMS